MIKINNKRDYLRFYWIFLLGMVLLATALMLAILRMSWLALLLYLILHYFFQRAFQLEMEVEVGRFRLSKRFLGLCYWQKQLELRQVVWDSPSASWFLHGQDGKSLQLSEDLLQEHSGLRVFDGKSAWVVGDAKAAKLLMNALEQELEAVGVKVYDVS